MMLSDRELEERLKQANEDVASLSRVSHKLAMTDAGPSLERVLDLLLPRLLKRIGSNHEVTRKEEWIGNGLLVERIKSAHGTIHEKLVEMLSHTMKRVRADSNCKLPCLAMLQLLLPNDTVSTAPAANTIDPFTLNLALAFLTLGLPRCTMEETERLLPGLLQLLPTLSGTTQSHQVAHLLLRTLERMSFTEDATSVTNNIVILPMTNTATIMDQVRELINQQPSIAETLYDLLLDVLLYQPSTSPNMPPPGLSQAGHERLLGFTEGTTSAVRLKIALIQIIAPTRRWAIFMQSGNILGTSRTVALLVVASGDAHLEVVDRAKGYLTAHLDGRSGLGDCVVLSCTLLALCLGATHAESVLKNSNIKSSLGTMILPSLPLNNTQSQQQWELSFKRRMVCDQTASAISTFVAKILDETPLILADAQDALAVGNLAVSASSKMLGSITSTLGLSVLRAAPYISASQLLNAVSGRIISTEMSSIGVKALSTACSVLSQASSPRPLSVHQEGSISIRDACYGVVCNLSRNIDFCNQGYMFSFGQDAPSITTTISVQTATLLFGCAANEAETLRPRALAALDALLGAYLRIYPRTDDQQQMKDPPIVLDNPWMTNPIEQESMNHTPEPMALDKTGLARSLVPLLWNAAQSTQAKASRVAAARWASVLLKTLDLSNACHLLCFLAGDADASTIAREGLGLTTADDKVYDRKTVLPDFADLTTVLFHKSSGTIHTWRPRFYDFSYPGKGASLRFGLVCLLHDLYGGDDDAVRIYVQALTDTLSLFGGSNLLQGRDSVDLLDECAKCLAGCMSTSAFARSMMMNGQTTLQLEDLESLTMYGASSKARRYLAEACGQLYEDTAFHGEINLLSWLQQTHLPKTLALCNQKVVQSQNDVFSVSEVQGAGFLGARCVRAFRLQAMNDTVKDSLEVESCWRDASFFIQSVGKGLSHVDEVIGNAFTGGLGIALSYDLIDAPILDARLYEGTASALLDLELALKRFGNGDHTDPLRVSSLVQAAGVVLAASTSAAGSQANIGSARTQCVDAVFATIGSTAARSDAEVALVAGEALATYADAYGDAVWSSVTDTWPDLYSESLQSALPPHQQVLYALLKRDLVSSNPHKRTATAPALLAIVGLAAKRVNNDISFSKRALVVGITKRLGIIQQAFVSLLADPRSKQLSRESSCLGLAACQGLAEALGKGLGIDTECSNLSLDLNERLLRAFGQTTNHGGSAMQETTAQNSERLRQNQQPGGIDFSSTSESFEIEPEVGGAAGLGEAALGAYREMAAAATSLGRPDVLYALLLLSVSHPVWFTAGPRDRYSASSLLGENSLVGNRTNSTEMREALRPHLGKLLPRLLRAKNDPNKQTREQMETLWLGLTGGGAEARQAITAHLLPTLDSLIDDAANKLWRARVGACGALTEVIVGRSWAELGGGEAVLDDDEVMIRTNTASTPAGIRLLRLWRAAMRAIDDVRGAVRESGEALARSVRAVTIRLCDPARAEHDSDSTEMDARCAASTSLRWLVKFGLSQAAPEASGICISCLIGVIEVVKPIVLEPSLPDLIGALLMAMSGLEPATLNYLQVRAAGSAQSDTYEQLERARLQMAQSGPIGGALHKCLDMVSSVQLQTQQAIVAHLDSALRTGAGFATRAAVADTVSTLCATCPNAFKFPGSSTTNPTVRLLRALYFASERERGQAAREKMAHALGNLASLAPGPSVRALAMRACARYARSTGNHDDPGARHASASALRALAVRASNQFADGGPSDIYRSRVLPMSYLGQKDNDTKVASMWREVWDEGGQSSGAMSEGYGVLLEERLLRGLVQSSIDALNDLSWTRRVSGATALLDLVQLNIMSPVDRTILEGSRNKEALSRAKQRAELSAIAIKACLDSVIRPRLWTGKTDVVRAMVAMACKWVMLGGPDDECADVFGCETHFPCPWRPIVWTTSNTLDDLFEGDKFFSRGAGGSCEILENAVTVEMDTSPTDDETDGDVLIDFEEGEGILAECDKEAVNDRMDEEESIGPILFSGICKVLLEQAHPKLSKQSWHGSPDELLPYKAAALQGISDLLTSLADSNDLAQSEKRYTYRFISPVLIPLIESDFVNATDETKESPHPPLIIARTIDCLSNAFWTGFGEHADGPSDDGTYMAKLLLRVQMNQSAWTVREASVLGAARLAGSCDIGVLRRHETITVLLDSSIQATKDRKFWRVRLAGLKLLRALVLRAGDAAESSANFSSGPRHATEGLKSKQLILEALLPSKEKILVIAKSSLIDNESQVTAVGTEICRFLSWWP